MSKQELNLESPENSIDERMMSLLLTQKSLHKQGNCNPQECIFCKTTKTITKN